MDPKKEKILKIIYGLSLLGIVVALYSLYGYYYGTINSFCNISTKFSCFAVYKSGYAAIFGVPIALFGVIGYGAIFTIAHYGLSKKIGRAKDVIFGLALVSVLFSAYLAYVSGFVVKVWCPTCITSYVLTLGVFACSVMLRRQKVIN